MSKQAHTKKFSLKLKTLVRELFDSFEKLQRKKKKISVKAINL